MNTRFLMAGVLTWMFLYTNSVVPDTVFIFTSTTPGWGVITTPATPSGLTSWDNPSSASTINDSSCTYEILMNAGGTYTISAASTPGTLTHSSNSPADTLTTTYMFVADIYNTSSGVGNLQSGINPAINYSSQGQNTFVAPSAFLNPGVQFITDSWVIFYDNDAFMTVTSRGRNPDAQDPSTPGDATEAPDEGNYSATMVLRITY